MKQRIGNIIVAGEKYLVLVRDNKYSRSLKLRKTGGDGSNLTDEGIFLNQQPKLLKELKEGKVITI